MKPVSGGTSQPDIVSMWHALKGTDYDLGIDIEKILETEEVFKECMKDYFLPPEALAVNPMIIQSPLPGGALTANTQMLRDNNLMDKYPEIVAAMKEVVEKGGFGTSVTPVSQFYFQQAFNNVMFGKWKKIAEGYGKMVLGYFGKTPCEPDSEVVKLASEQLKLQPTTECVVDINDKDPNKGIEAARKMLKDAGLEETEENIFIAAACKEKGILFLEGKGTIGVRKNEQKTETSDSSANGYTVTINGKKYYFTTTGIAKNKQLNLQPTTEKVVDLNDKDPDKGIEAAKKMLKDANLEETEENIFIAAACKEKGILFLEGKATLGIRKNEPNCEPKVQASANGYTVSVNGKKYAVALEGKKATVNGKLYDFDIKSGIEAPSAGSSDGAGTPVKAALPGTVLKVLVEEGDVISAGDVIAVIEAMKMETEIKSPVSGTISSVEIEVGNQVQTGQVLVTVG